MTKPKAYVGIDPGQKGAAALISDMAVDVFDFPGFDKIAPELRQWIDDFDIQVALIEDQFHRKHECIGKHGGVFGNFGFWRGMLTMLGVPIMICPATGKNGWQKHIIHKSDGIDSKSRSVAAARRLYPNVNLYGKRGALKDGRADALCMAEVARRLSV